MRRIIAIGLILSMMYTLTACGGSESVSDSTTDDKTDSALSIEQIDEVTYAQCLKAYREKIDALLEETPIDSDTLWNLYSALYYVQMEEYLFKGKLNVEYYHEGGSDFPGKEVILDSCDSVLDEMNLHFSEDQMDTFTLNRTVDAVSFYDVVSVNHYKIEDRKGRPDLNASWENFFQQNIDPEDLAKTFLFDRGTEILLSFPDGTQLTNEGSYQADWGEFRIQQEEMTPQRDFLNYLVDKQDDFSRNDLHENEVGIDIHSDNLCWEATDQNGDNFSATANWHLLADYTTCYVTGYIILTDWRYVYTITFKSNGTDEGYAYIVDTVNNIQINGTNLIEPISTVFSVSEAIEDMNMTDIQRHQQILDEQVATCRNNHLFYENDMTGSFCTAENDTHIEIFAYQTDLSAEPIYYMNYQSDSLTLRNMQCSYAPDDDWNLVICYLDYSFPSLEGSVFVYHDTLDDTYTFNSYIAGNLNAKGCYEHIEYINPKDDISEIYQDISGNLERLESFG